MEGDAGKKAGWGYAQYLKPIPEAVEPTGVF